MKLFRKCKKALVVTMTAVMLSSSLSVPVLAHGHGGTHHSSASTASGTHHNSSYQSNCTGTKKASNGYYCSYHCKSHKKKSNCKKYCKKHQTTHKNGKRHKCA